MLNQSISENIRQIIALTQPKLLALSPQAARHKPDQDTWSKQEILGHLIDSALNNHQRFVRAAMNMAGDFPPYDQNRWVAVQGYNERNWGDLVALWAQCHDHLCQILERLPEEALANPVNIGRENPVTLAFVVEDYLRHLKMHLEQILEA